MLNEKQKCVLLQKSQVRVPTEISHRGMEENKDNSDVSPQWSLRVRAWCFHFGNGRRASHNHKVMVARWEGKLHVDDTCSSGAHVDM